MTDGTESWEPIQSSVFSKVHSRNESIGMTLCWRLWTSSLSPKATLATELASVALKNKSAFFSRMSITQGLLVVL